jgi:hypothetical protein
MSALASLVQQQIGAVHRGLEAAGYTRAPRRQNPRWSKAEDEKLRHVYETQGRKACEEAFAGKRSAGAVQNRCNKLRLVGTRQAALGRLRWRLQCAREKVQMLEDELARREGPKAAQKGRWRA